MTFRAWICETCRRPQKFRDNIWDCPGCGKEGCDDCFDRYFFCKACSEGKTDEELRVAANTFLGEEYFQSNENKTHDPI
jgi:hypothetical protein